MKRYSLLVILSLATSFSWAEDCVCKSKGSSQFVSQSCPKVKPGEVKNPEPISFWFRSIELPNLMSLIADFASVDVCLSTSATGFVNVRIDPEMPWPDVVSGMAENYGLTSTINNEQILILGDYKWGK